MSDQDVGGRSPKSSKTMLEMLDESVTMIEIYRGMFAELQQLASNILDEVAAETGSEDKMSEVARAQFAIAKTLTQILQRTINELTEVPNGRLRK